jgi:hypothetical protein
MSIQLGGNMGSVKVQSTRLDLPDDAEEVYAYFEANGYGDGHPVIPPTVERVERFLEAGDQSPDTEIAVLDPGKGVATIEKIAINAVMAGCLPAHMDVIIAALEAHASFPKQGTVMTTAHSLSPLIVVNGPIAKELGIGSGAGGSAVSWRANAAIARAVRLCLINIAGIPGSTDCNTFVWLPKYMYCVAENDEENPWEPFAIEKGYSRDDDVVTVFWKEPAHHLEVMWPTTAQELLAAFCDSMCTVASRSSYGEGQVLMGFCPDQAQLCAKGGFSKQDVKRFMFENARKPLRAYGPKAVPHFKLEWQKFYTSSPDTMMPMVGSPDQIEIIVIGGAGPNSLYFPHGYGPFTRKIARHWRPART